MAKVSIQLIQVTCAIVWCLLAAGPIFGFAALKPILISEGVYGELCTPNNDPILSITAGRDALMAGKAPKPCTAQDLKLNLMFTVGAGTTNVVALFVGWILDSYGPRVCGFIGSGFLTLGALSLGWSSNISLFDPYIVGYVLLAIGGPFVFISCFQLANSFPKRSGTVLAIITGAFDTSSALFFFYRVAYQNWKPDLTLKKFFNFYLVVPLFIFLCQLFIMPKESYKTLGAVQKLEVEGLDENGNLPEGEDGSRIIPDDDERQSLLSTGSPVIRPVLSSTSGRKSIWENYVEAKLEKKTKGIFGVMHDYTAIEQIKSPWFLFMLVFTIICMLRINYFVATVRSQEEYLLGDADAALKMNSIFDVALPLGGVVAIPFIGLVLDHCSTLTALTTVASISVLIGVLGLTRSFLLNLIGILILVAYRPFYYTVVSDYCAKVFGFETFGTVYGLLMCISGVCNMGQSLLDRMTHRTFNMDPTPVNSILVTITVVSAGCLLWYVNRESKIREEKMKILESIADPNDQEQTAYGST
ncbi:LAFE_0E06282g1_1 [Lachancea fermentati]|uniref:LAFE_0E06282g1_1 n=1 Tax=Lachancea fermentati TaxID=4955 RepID=A0A1G4MCW0_LACFM|nr:LAFE_0E06282g1_1 [Lachancea fermentati]